MKKALFKNSFITGTLFLTIAGVLTRIIGFFYRIFLSRIIGAEGLGIYQLIFPVFALCIAFSASGIQTSISKFVSMEIGKNNPSGARLYLVTGLVLSLFLSALTNVLLWANADWIALHWMGDVRCTPLLKILSFSFVPSCIHCCINGYYYGLKKTAIPSLCQFTEQIARVGSVWLLCQIQLSQGKPVTISLAIWGLVIGEAASTLVSVSAIGIQKCSGNLFRCTKNLVSMAVPLTANRVVLNLFSSYENIMIPNRLRLFGYTNSEALGVYGILTGMAMAVIMFPSVITNSVSVLLLPTISEAQAKGNTAMIHRTIRRTVKSCLLLGFLCTAGFLVTGNFIGNVLFENALAGKFILTMGWICPFLYLGSTLSSILHGLGFPSITFVLNLIACGIRILFVLFAIPVFGIRGYLWGLLTSQIVMALLAIFILSKKLYSCSAR